MINALSKQLPLIFNRYEEASYENYYTGNNTEVVAHLQSLVKNPSFTENTYLFSCQGIGRSHLLQAACHHANQAGMSTIYIPLLQNQLWTPDVLVGLESISLICLDDIQAIAGNVIWEEAIFHLYNREQTAHSRLVVTANALPKAIQVSLPDLVSRLSWGVVYQLQALQDQEKLVMLMMRAARRGMTLSEDVARYILTHCPRHMSILISALDVLDKASLAAKRRLTVPFVKEVLQI